MPTQDQDKIPDKFPIVILISGHGSNLQAIIDTINNDDLAVSIKAVISNNPDAYGLVRASKAQIKTEVIDHHNYPDREKFDHQLQTCIDSYQPKLIILAGFMRIFTPEFVTHFKGRLLNIHPSLLPQFRGLNTHQRALDAGVTEHGLSVHLVTAELDDGPVIIQARITIEKDDTNESLTKRIQQLEHKIYPLVISWFSQGRLRTEDNQVFFDNKPITKAIDYATIEKN